MDLPLFLVMTVLVPAAGAFMVPAAGAAMAAVVGTGNVWLIAKPAFQIFLHSVVRISSNSAGYPDYACNDHLSCLQPYKF